MQFLAARSLCTNFLAFRYAMPSAISAAIWIISFRVGGGRPGLFCRIRSVVTHTEEFLHTFLVFRSHTCPELWCLSSNRPVSCHFPYVSDVYLHTGNDKPLSTAHTAKVTFLRSRTVLAAQERCIKDSLTLVYLSIRAQGAQVALQVSIGHELHHHQGGLTFRDNTQQTHLEDKCEWFSFLGGYCPDRTWWDIY